MPLEAEPLYHDALVDRVIAYLQTRNPLLFPFTRKFDAERQHAFMHDLRMGLSEINDSGSKRGTASTGYITSDAMLRAIVEDWAEANGGWPRTQDPSNPQGIAGAAPFD